MLNAAFTPTAEELEHVRAVLQALDRGARDGAAGAVLFNGHMLDEAVAAAARRVLARAGEAA